MTVVKLLNMLIQIIEI